MKILKKILKVLLIIVCVIALFFGFAFANYKLYKIPEISATAKNTTGLIEAIGRGLYDKDGNEIVLKGVNAGTTFITEGWLAPYSVSEPDENNEYATMSESEFIQGFNSNPNLTDEQRAELLDIFYSNWFSKEDVKNIKELGMNCVRVPFYYAMLLNEDYTRKSEDEAFYYLDRLISWCKEEDIFVILDLHGAPLSQNGYEHSGALKYTKKMDSILLWDDEAAINATVDLWKYISEHYKDSELAYTIASYDIMNEPRGNTIGTTKKCWDVFDKIYDAIRDNGDNHIITMEGCWDFAALPNPNKYGWENVMYEYHWYNWVSSWLDDTFFYMYQGIQNIGRNYDVPVFIGEFTLFDDEADWKQALSLYEDRHYSWTIWTYKMSVYGWWQNSWGLYNLNVWEGEEYKYSKRVNVATASYEEIKEVFEWVITPNAKESTTCKYVREFLSK